MTTLQEVIEQFRAAGGNPAQHVTPRARDGTRRTIWGHILTPAQYQAVLDACQRPATNEIVTEAQKAKWRALRAAERQR